MKLLTAFFGKERIKIENVYFFFFSLSKLDVVSDSTAALRFCFFLELHRQHSNLKNIFF